MTKRTRPAASPARGIADSFGGEWTAEDFDENLAVRSYPFGRVLKAWMPFGILSVVVLVWGLPRVKLAVEPGSLRHSRWCKRMAKCGPGRRVGTCPICTMRFIGPRRWWTNRLPEAARYDFNWLSATGTGCFIAAIISGLLLGLSPIRTG